MNGEEYNYFGLETVGQVLNQPEVQENYPMDFSGYNFPEPAFDIQTAGYTPPPSSAPAPLTKEASTDNQLLGLFGRVLDVAGKSYQQVASKAEIQKFKSTPYISSALNNLGYPSVRKPQTGIDTGILTTSVSPIQKAVSSVLSLSPMILIAGVGILVFVVMMGKK